MHFLWGNIFSCSVIVDLMAAHFPFTIAPLPFTFWEDIGVETNIFSGNSKFRINKTDFDYLGRIKLLKVSCPVGLPDEDRI